MPSSTKLMDTDQVRRAVTRIAHEILERNQGTAHLTLENRAVPGSVPLPRP